MCYGLVDHIPSTGRGNAGGLFNENSYLRTHDHTVSEYRYPCGVGMAASELVPPWAFRVTPKEGSMKASCRVE